MWFPKYEIFVVNIRAYNRIFTDSADGTAATENEINLKYLGNEVIFSVVNLPLAS